MTGDATRRAWPATLVVPIQDIDPIEWNHLISADPTSSAFHTYEWLASLKATYPRWEVAAIVARNARRIEAALPFVRRRISGVVLVESLPFGAYGGVIRADTGFEDGVLIERFLTDSRERFAVVRLVQRQDVPSSVRRGVTTSRSSAVLDISHGYEDTASRYRPNVRKNLKHARGLGLVVQPVTDQSSIETFWNLAAYAYRLHSELPPYQLELYEMILRLLVPARRATFELAYSGGKAVAGSLHLIGAHEMFNWLTPAYRETQDLRANTLLIDNAIRSATALGLQTYNLGASQGSDGLARFKSAWGAQEAEYSVMELMSRPVAVAYRLRALIRTRGRPTGKA